MDSVLSLVGLIFRAKKLYLGEKCLDNIGKVKYLFIASDASNSTKERYLKKCYYYKIPYCLKYSCDELSNCVGKFNVKIVGVFDQGFTNLLKDKLKEDYNG